MPTWWYWLFAISMVIWIATGLVRVAHGDDPPARIGGLIEIAIATALTYGIWVYAGL